MITKHSVPQRVPDPSWSWTAPTMSSCHGRQRPGPRSSRAASGT